MPAASTEKSSLLGVTLFTASATGWILSFAGVLLLPDWWMKILASLSLSLFIDFLFVIGHDACHGSLTPHRRLNQLLGRAAFLTSLHPYTSWEHTHNGKHHAWTNFRGRDIVFAPFDADSFTELPSWRRVLERFYRTPIGLGLFYFVDVYLKHEILPTKSRLPRSGRIKIHLADRMLTLGFAVLWLTVLVTYAVATGISLVGLVVVGFLVPLMLFHQAMGFVIYLHHTHPETPWFDNKTEWSYFKAQVNGSVHMEFPWLIDLLLHRIMHHTAHHADVRIPLYNLVEAQRSLEEAYRSDILHVDWSWRGFIQTTRICRLYDYEAHQWCDWDGSPAGPAGINLQRQSTPRIRSSD